MVNSGGFCCVSAQVLQGNGTLMGRHPGIVVGQTPLWAKGKNAEEGRKSLQSGAQACHLEKQNDEGRGTCRESPRLQRSPQRRPPPGPREESLTRLVGLQVSPVSLIAGSSWRGV